MAELSMSRRRFLQATGWTAAGVTLVYFAGRSVLSRLPSFDIPGEDAGAAWLQIRPDGRCRMFCPRAEMGQNASIGLAQIAAEELNVAVEEIDIRFPNASEIPQVILTAGSMSLALFAEPTARAAAALREVMRERAAERTGADREAVAGRSGRLRASRWPQPLSYADLAAGEPVILDAGKVPDALRSTASMQERPHRQIGRRAAPHPAGADRHRRSGLRVRSEAAGHAVRPRRPTGREKRQARERRRQHEPRASRAWCR